MTGVAVREAVEGHPDPLGGQAVSEQGTGGRPDRLHGAADVGGGVRGFEPGPVQEP